MTQAQMTQAVERLSPQQELVAQVRSEQFRSQIALLASEAMGLMPDNREAALVPFKGKAQLVPMIAGYRKIAAEYGWTIYTAIAYEADLFEYELGLDVRFRHAPARPRQ